VATRGRDGRLALTPALSTRRGRRNLHVAELLNWAPRERRPTGFFGRRDLHVAELLIRAPRERRPTGFFGRRDLHGAELVNRAPRERRPPDFWGEGTCMVPSS
jgi:hypothetical protein